MKILVTGVNGQLGYDVAKALIARGHQVIGCGSSAEYRGIAAPELSAMRYESLDITDKAAVKRVFADIKPDAVIHCASWTAVDAAEDEENRPRVYAVNVEGTKNLAEAVRDADAKMVDISTDYVFGGMGDTPWKADDETFAPLNYYGYTKLEGERQVRAILDRFFIVRIAWVFGANGRNFVKTMLNVGKTHDTVRVVCDQIGTPTYTRDLAVLLADMVESDKYGVYHATNEGGYISWYDFTKEIYRQAGLKTVVLPVTTEEYGLSAARRPFNSRLDKSKLSDCGFSHLPTWQDALGRYLKEIGAQDGTD